MQTKHQSAEALADQILELQKTQFSSHCLTQDTTSPCPGINEQKKTEAVIEKPNSKVRLQDRESKSQLHSLLLACAHLWDQK